jgi:F-type H+-transporting ATPase subunit b
MGFVLLAQEHGAGDKIAPTDLTHPANLAAAAWAWGIFVVLVFLLGKFAWGPIAKGLDARSHRISESLKKAEEIEKATRELADTNRQLLAKAQQDAQGIVAEARAAAKITADDVLARAHADVEAQRERFVRETQLLVDKAREDLRRETVQLTIDATSRLIGRTLSDADSRRLAEQSLVDAESVARN